MMLVSVIDWNTLVLQDVASGGCEGEVPGVSGTVLTVHRQNTATSMTGILEQNISLRAKYGFPHSTVVIHFLTIISKEFYIQKCY